MISTRRGWLIAAVVVLSFAACSDDGGESETSGDEATEASSDEQLDTLETTLRNAATSQEAYAAENFTYTDSVADLEAAGLNIPSDHSLEVVTATETEYCLEASVDDAVMHLESAAGTPAEGTC